MARNGFEMVRYADDFVVLCGSQEQAQEALEQISQWVEENGLTLHPSKTRLVDASQRGGFDFLGYHFERGKKWPRKKSLDKLKDTIRSKTRRTRGRNMKAICEDLNRTLRGWFGYFKHSDAARAREPSMATCADDCAASSDTGANEKAELAKAIINDGPIAYFSAVGLYLLKTSAHCGMPIFLKVNHQLESRMREIRQSGSEGGAKPSLSLPLF